MIKIKRIYDVKEPGDGFRVLVDRLWPRGISNKAGKIDLWLSDIGPSSHLRKWFAHEDTKWEKFKRLYQRELKDKSELISQIKSLEKDHETITLLYSASNVIHNQAVVLRDFLEKVELNLK